MVYYPAAFPLRVAVKTNEQTKPFLQIIGSQDFTQFLDSFSTVVAQNPWIDTFPVLVAQVVPIFQEKKFYLVDSDKKMLPIFTYKKEELGWQLMALSGGKPVAVFGEWKGDILLPLSVFADGRFIAF